MIPKERYLASGLHSSLMSFKTVGERASPEGLFMTIPLVWGCKGQALPGLRSAKSHQQLTLRHPLHVDGHERALAPQASALSSGLTAVWPAAREQVGAK